MGTFEDVLEQSSRKPGGPAPFLTKRRPPHQSTRRASYTDLANGLWDLELHPVEDLEQVRDEIKALAGRALDPNLFFEPTALDAFWPRMKVTLKIQEPLLLCLYEYAGSERNLRLFMPVASTNTGFPSKHVLQILATDFLPDGTPLLDPSAPEETCQILFQTLCDPALQLPAIIDFRFLRTESPTAKFLFKAAGSLDLQSDASNRHQRASLGQTSCEMTKKRRKEQARQRRRLGELGELTFHSTRAPCAMIDCFENHLALELSGWKGRRGTALYNNKSSASFSRHFVGELAKEGICEISSLKLDDRTIASLVLLGTDPRVLTWKIAYDETLSAYSPGVQLALHVTSQLQQRKDFQLADSLAVANHPMIDHLWHERISITDWTVALNENANKSLAKTIASKNRYERLRAPLSYLRRKFEKRF